MTRTIEVVKEMGTQALEGIAAGYAPTTMDRLLTPKYNWDSEGAPIIEIFSEIPLFLSAVSSLYAVLSDNPTGFVPAAIQGSTMVMSRCYEWYRDIKECREMGSRALCKEFPQATDYQP